MINAEILDVKAIRSSEALTMAEEPISSIDLMERAGTCFAEHLMRHLPLDKFAEIVVVCGPGNNGGDGLVIARILQQHWIVRVIWRQDRIRKPRLNLTQTYNAGTTTMPTTKHDSHGHIKKAALSTLVHRHLSLMRFSGLAFPSRYRDILPHWWKYSTRRRPTLLPLMPHRECESTNIRRR